MPNSLHNSTIVSPASRRATNCNLSSVTEHSFQGIVSSPYGEEVLPMCSVRCVTYVSGRSQGPALFFKRLHYRSDPVANCGKAKFVFLHCLGDELVCFKRLYIQEIAV